MSDKKESAMTKVTDAEYIRGLDANGNSILINKASLSSVIANAIGIANTSKNGLQRGAYSHSGDIYLQPGQVIDTKLNYGLLIINHPGSGDSAVFLCGHSYINLIMAKFSILLDDTPDCLYVYKESGGTSVKIKNNFSTERLMSFHCL